jgi:hypothetical protein
VVVVTVRGNGGEDVTETPVHEEDPEEFAEAVGVDPTAEEVDEYRKKVGDPPPEPPVE